MTLPSAFYIVFVLLVNSDHDKQYFIGLCTDVGTSKFMPLEFIKFNSDYVLMYNVYVGYVLCLHAYFHSAHICMLYNSVKCVHYLCH